jgi:hypothetical protein
MKTNLGDSFSGEVSIDIEFLYNSKCIVLNASHLKIEEGASFNQDTGIKMTELPGGQAVMFILNQEFAK